MDSVDLNKLDYNIYHPHPPKKGPITTTKKAQKKKTNKQRKPKNTTIVTDYNDKKYGRLLANKNTRGALVTISGFAYTSSTA